MNSSSQPPDIIINYCDPNFNPIFEISMYLVQFLYLGVGLFLHLSILKTIYFTKKIEFKGSSFFQIFALDSVFSIIIIIDEIFFNRIFIYVSPFCPILSPYFWEPSILLKALYASTNYGRLGKSVAQIMMVLNRMSCILQPTHYRNAWKLLTPICCTLIAVLPMCGIWNVMISRVYVDTFRGGFTANYIKAVKWAALSLFQSIFTLTALFFTIICTSITLYKLIVLPNRIKTVEKSLCFTSIFNSITFLLVAATQFSFLFCSSCDIDVLLLLQSVAFDIFTVGTSVILILTSSQIRKSIFKTQVKDDDRVLTASLHLT